MSFLSKLAEAAIRLDNTKKEFSDDAEFERHIDQVRVSNEREHKMPVKINAGVKIFNFKGMKCYEIKKTGSRSQNAVLYLHGGAYINRPCLFHWWFLSLMAKRTGATFIVPMYPLSPVHTAVEAHSLVQTLYDEMRKVFRSGKIIVMGDSAGGGFSLAACQKMKLLEKRQPDEIILISPWLDVTMKNPDMPAAEPLDVMLAIPGLKKCGEMWAGELQTCDPMISPINGDIGGLAPITLFGGTHDLLLPDIRLLAERAGRENVKLDYHEYPDLGHCFPLMPIPDSNSARKTIVSKIK